MAAIVPQPSQTATKPKTTKTLTYDVLFSILCRHATKGPQNLLQGSNALAL
jgi:hypothetical protein